MFYHREDTLETTLSYPTQQLSITISLTWLFLPWPGPTQPPFYQCLGPLVHPVPESVKFVTPLRGSYTNHSNKGLKLSLLELNFFKEKITGPASKSFWKTLSSVLNSTKIRFSNPNRTNEFLFLLLTSPAVFHCCRHTVLLI